MPDEREREGRKCIKSYYQASTLGQLVLEEQ